MKARQALSGSQPVEDIEDHSISTLTKSGFVGLKVNQKWQHFNKASPINGQCVVSESLWGQRWIWNDRIGLVLHLTRTSGPLITQTGLTCSAEGVFICGRRRWSWQERGKRRKKTKESSFCWRGWKGKKLSPIAMGSSFNSNREIITETRHWSAPSYQLLPSHHFGCNQFPR